MCWKTHCQSCLGQICPGKEEKLFCEYFRSPGVAKDILLPHLLSLNMFLPLGVQAGNSSLHVGEIWGERLALLYWLCDCSQQDYFHSKCVIAMNKWEMGVVAGAVWTIKGNASALHMLCRGRVSVCPGKGDVVRDRVWREGVCMKTRGEGSIWERVGGWWPASGNGTKESVYGCEGESLLERNWEQKVCVRGLQRRDERQNVCGWHRDGCSACTMLPNRTPCHRCSDCPLQSHGLILPH